jgi:hypothetical protein
MTAVGTDEKPLLRVEMENGSVLMFDDKHLSRTLSDMFDWRAVFDDLKLDRIHRERNAEHGV